jgi:hypothetical protein
MTLLVALIENSAWKASGGERQIEDGILNRFHNSAAYFDDSFLASSNITLYGDFKHLILYRFIAAFLRDPSNALFLSWLHKN